MRRWRTGAGIARHRLSSGRRSSRDTVTGISDRLRQGVLVQHAINLDLPRTRIAGHGRCWVYRLDRLFDRCGAMAATHIRNLEAAHICFLQFSALDACFPHGKVKGEKMSRRC